MDVPDVLDWVRRNHRVVLATLRKDGSPQLTPVTIGLDSDDKLVISSRETAMKVKNLRRDPRAWLCLLNDGFFGDFMQAEGPVEIIELPEAMDGLMEYYRGISGEHPDWDDYRAAMEREQRVLLRITPTRVGPNVSG
jgi:PPOX class probable F420-dependent enzyme